MSYKQLFFGLVLFLWNINGAMGTLQKDTDTKNDARKLRRKDAKKDILAPSIETKDVTPESYLKSWKNFVNLVRMRNKLNENILSVTSWGFTPGIPYSPFVTFQSSYFKTIKNLYTLNDFKTAPNKDVKKEIANSMVELYKIHLMPKDKEDLEYVLEKLLTNPKIMKLIGINKFDTIKVMTEIPFHDFYLGISDRHREYMQAGLPSGVICPIVVIYVYGKKDTQKVLNYLLDEFGHMQGLNLVPRFNIKCTSLIYYAQGNGGDKEKNYNKEFYNRKRTLYRSDITGSKREFELQ